MLTSLQDRVTTEEGITFVLSQGGASLMDAAGLRFSTSINYRLIYQAELKTFGTEHPVRVLS